MAADLDRHGDGVMASHPEQASVAALEEAFASGAKTMRNDIDVYLLDLIARRIAERPSHNLTNNDEVIEAVRMLIRTLPVPVRS